MARACKHTGKRPPADVTDGVQLPMCCIARAERTLQQPSLPLTGCLAIQRRKLTMCGAICSVISTDAAAKRSPALVASAARDQLNRPEEEAGSVLSTALSYLTIYRDPVVAANVSRSDFCIQDLMQSEEPVTLYIVTEPVDKQRLQPLVRVLVNMIVRLSATGLSFEGGMPKPNYRHRLLLMLDEFPSLGKLDILQESLAFLPGYGIKAYLIAQDINQLYAHYGRDEAITSTCHVQCAFVPNRIETAEHLSKLTGQTTVVKEQVTTSGRGWSTNVSRSTHEVSRPLLTPDETMRMKGARKNAQGMITEAGNMVIYVAGYPAIMGLQPLYFRDSELARRARIPAEPAQTKQLGDTLATASG